MCGGSESSTLGAQPAGAWGAVCGAGRPLCGLCVEGGLTDGPGAERCVPVGGMAPRVVERAVLVPECDD